MPGGDACPGVVSRGCVPGGDHLPGDDMLPGGESPWGCLGGGTLPGGDPRDSLPGDEELCREGKNPTWKEKKG